MSDRQLTMVVSDTFGTFTFDAVFMTSHSQSATVTDHPVQSGATLSDHAYLNPVEIPINIGISDVAYNAGTISGNSANRSVAAYDRLLQLMQLFEPVTLITRLKTYENMLVTSIAADDDVSTKHALKATVIFRQIQRAQIASVTIQQTVSSSKSSNASNTKEKDKSSTTQSSSSTAQPANQSVVKKVWDKIFGKG